jgi:hypothetical protein
VTAPTQIRPLWSSDPRGIRIGVTGKQQDYTVRPQMTLERLEEVMRIDYVLNDVKR